MEPQFTEGDPPERSLMSSSVSQETVRPDRKSKRAARALISQIANPKEHARRKSEIEKFFEDIQRRNSVTVSEPEINKPENLQRRSSIRSDIEDERIKEQVVKERRPLDPSKSIDEMDFARILTDLDDIGNTTVIPPKGFNPLTSEDPDYSNDILTDYSTIPSRKRLSENVSPTNDEADQESPINLEEYFTPEKATINMEEWIDDQAENTRHFKIREDTPYHPIILPVNLAIGSKDDSFEDNPVEEDRRLREDLTRRLALLRRSSDEEENKCFNCKKVGHSAKNCRQRAKKGWKPKPDRFTPRDTTKLNVISEVQINFKKLHEKATIPKRATPGSAGYDLTPCEDGVIKKFSTVKINTGLALEIPKNHVGLIKARSSCFSKQLNIDGVIDSDYRGPIYIQVQNLSSRNFEYSAKGKPIAQLLLIPIFTPELNQVENLSQTTRQGGFGSTDTKLNAASDPENRSSKLVFQGKIKNKDVKILIDSGADKSFISEEIAKKLKLQRRKLENPYSVALPDGQEYVISHQAPNVKFKIQNYEGVINLEILPMKSEEVIFGNPWLAEIDPVISFKDRSLTIKDGDK